MQGAAYTAVSRAAPPLLSSSSGSTRGSTSRSTASHRPHFQLTFSPPCESRPTILSSRQRIRCQAWQPGGVGACGAGRTCTFIARACGKWSPSGDTGEAAEHRTDPVVSRPERRAGCACAAHKGAGSGGCVGIVRRDDSSPERRQTPFRRQGPQGEVLHGEKPERPIPETGGRHPRITAFAEGPESQAKTAERGAERCHLYFFIRGSFQRPVLCLPKPTGAKSAAWLLLLEGPCAGQPSS